MVIKRKKNCKLIFINDKYYVQTNKNLYRFDTNYVEALEYYKNISEVEKRGHLPIVSNGKFRVELYPDEFKDILNSIEIYKFMIDKSLFFECNHESLKAKSFDLEFLYDCLFNIYNNHIKEIEEIKLMVEKNNTEVNST